jgi:hypothetical protein
LFLNKCGVNENKFYIEYGMNINTATAAAPSTTTATNNNIKNNAYFFSFEDGEGRTQVADHETLPDLTTDI